MRGRKLRKKLSTSKEEKGRIYLLNERLEGRGLSDSSEKKKSIIFQLGEMN